MEKHGNSTDLFGEKGRICCFEGDWEFPECNVSIDHLKKTAIFCSYHHRVRQNYLENLKTGVNFILDRESDFKKFDSDNPEIYKAIVSEYEKRKSQGYVPMQFIIYVLRIDYGFKILNIYTKPYREKLESEHPWTIGMTGNAVKR